MTAISSVQTLDDLQWPLVDTIDGIRDAEQIPLSGRGIPNSTYELVMAAARTWPDRDAVILLPRAASWETPIRWTFTDLADKVRRVANVLINIGVERGDTVTLMSPNTALLLATIIAAQSVGVAAPINPAQSAERIEELMRKCGTTVLVAAGPELDQDMWNKALALANTVGIKTVLVLRPDGAVATPPAHITRGDSYISYLEDEMLRVDSAELAAQALPRIDDISSFFHTGGTTGAPKLAAHTQLNQLSMAWMLAAAAPIGDAATALAGLPLFHVNAVMVTVLAPLMRGNTVLWTGPAGYRDIALYQNFWKIIERYKIAAMSAVPTVYAVLTNVPIDADISCLKLAAVGAAPLPVTVATGFAQHTGLELSEGYGLSEATCASAVTRAGAGRAGSVGQRLPYQDIRTANVHEDGSYELHPDGRAGELLISGPTVFAGYVKTGPEGRLVDQGASVRDGWLFTGDIGVVDADGYVCLNGRTKDLIIRGGHNIDPVTIEEAVLAHPNVSAAAAVGRPDTHSGEVPVVFVVAAEGTTADEIVHWCRDHITESAAVPKTVHFIDAIPTTEIGKPFKPALREITAAAAVLEHLRAAGIAGDKVHVEAGHKAGRLTVDIEVDTDSDSMLAEVRHIAEQFALAIDVHPAPVHSAAVNSASAMDSPA